MTAWASVLWRTWDRLSIYLPIILMGLLALGTYWLAKNTPSFSGPGTPRVLTHEPDYFMRRFSVKSFDPAGRLKSELYGAEARHYPDTDTVEVDEPRIRVFGEQGMLTMASAKRALSNADGSEIQLLGEAVVTRQPAQGPPDAPQRLEIRGEFLHLFTQAEKVRSHKPVVLRRGPNVFSADSLEYDNLDRVLELRGRVQGRIAPREGP